MRLKRLLIVSTVALGIATVASASAEPGFIGLQVQGMSAAIANALGLKRGDGAMVRDVALGSPADQAGFQRGDLILTFNGKAVDTFEELTALAGNLSVGESAEVEVLRADGETTLVLTAAPWPEGRKVERGSFAAIDPLGITLAALTPKVRDRLALRWGTTGVAVTLVDPEKEGALGLKRGELIIQVNQETVWDPKQIIDAYDRAKAKGRTSMLILVEGEDGFRFMLLPVL
jgi:serine protease Do